MIRALIYATFVLSALGITSSLAGDAAITNCRMLSSTDEVYHGGGLNDCGCHIEHRTGLCHCHRPPACGC